jgi:hypothetical protein
VEFIQLKMLGKPLLGKLAYIVCRPARSSQSCTPKKYCNNSSSRLFGVRLSLNKIVIYKISSFKIDILFYINKILLIRENKIYNSGLLYIWRRFPIS